MSVLPAHPDLDQARRRAKELLHAAQDRDAAALARLAAVSAPLTLAGAQLALARELGQPSWAALVREIEARSASMSENVVRFLRSSVNLQIGAAARMRIIGPNSMVVTNDGSHSIFVGTMWAEGIWRYVEPD